MLFDWSYKQCPCCRSTIPDSRSDQLGSCEVCQKPRVLLDGPPEGWFEQVVLNAHDLKKRRLTTRWMNDWRNRGEHELCPHERKVFYRGKGAKVR